MKSTEKEERIVAFVLSAVILFSACQKTGSTPDTLNSASVTIVNAIPGSNPVIPVFNTGGPITYFGSALTISYGSYKEYLPTGGGDDTTYIVQQNSDTMDIDWPKSGGLIFYQILNLQPRSIHALFLTGSDTSSPDYLFTTDSIPYHPSTDSVVGIRFVNLSTDSSPISVNLEGNNNGSEVQSLPYLGLTGFIAYPCNSTVRSYLFVIRDAISGDSLTNFALKTNRGYGLIDPTTNKLLTFKNVTIAIYGSDTTGTTNPVRSMLVDDY